MRVFVMKYKQSKIYAYLHLADRLWNEATIQWVEDEFSDNINGILLDPEQGENDNVDSNK